MNPLDRITTFVGQARRVLNRSTLVAAGMRGLVLASAIAIAGGLAFIVYGRAVPGWVFGVSGLVGAVAMLTAWFFRRRTPMQTAHQVDREFALKDGVSTALGFRGKSRSGGFHELQEEWVARKLEGLDAKSLRRRPARRWVAAAAVLPAIAVVLGLQGPSQAFLEQQAAEDATTALATELNEGIRQELDQLKKDIEGTDQEELIDPDALRELAAELEVTPDEEELLRQYAEMEQAISQRETQLEQLQASELLRAAGQELGKAEDTQRLGEKLAQKQFDEAADELEKMTPTDETVSESELQAKRKETEQLKEVASRMAQAARRFQASQASSGSAGSSSGGANGRAGTLGSQGALSERESSDRGEESEADRLARMMEELEDALEELEESLSECEGGNCTQEGLKRAGEATRSARSASKDLQDRLRRMSASRRAKSRMQSMRQTLSQCQGAVAGQCESPFNRPGGQNAGTGVANNQNESETPTDGRSEQLTGIKGAGESETIIEEADSGSGTTYRSAKSREVEYQRALESFVERPDVPESVKQGVKRYFETIHRADSSSESGAESTSAKEAPES